MTVKELIAELQKYPEDLEIIVYNEELEFTYFPIQGVKQCEVGFSEDPNSEPLTKEQCVVLIAEQ